MRVSRIQRRAGNWVTYQNVLFSLISELRVMIFLSRVFSVS